MRVTSLNGKNLYYLFLAGAKKILENQAEINKINVFPVPDADTGTNLASTIRSIIDNVRPDPSYKITADAIAIAALDGARGNSGVIFAQFLYGLSNETSDCREVSISIFSESINHSIKYIYEAFSNPVEGTMLTVIREWAQYIDRHKERLEDFTHLLHESCEAAKKSLFETTAKLKELAKANVVDAGGKGFVLFLEGIIEYVKTGNIRQVLELKGQKELFEFQEEEIDITSLKYQYCSEALIRGEKLDKEKIRETVSSLGDSIIVAGSDTNLRLHIHTNEPAELFEILRPFGTLAFQKADDMFRQYKVAHNRKYNIALVTDSTCDMPEEVYDKYQVQQIPLNLHVGNNNYLDKLTIQPGQFYKLLDEATEHPTTSQINEKTFVNMYSHLASHYDSVISIHLSDPLSGTYRSSQRAAQKISAEMNKTVSTINSGTVSGAIGLLVMEAARMIKEGRNHWDIVKSIENLRKDTHIYVSLKTMKNLVRSGRISPLKGWLARLLNLRPVIFVNSDGKVDMLEKSFGQEGTLTKILRHIRRLIKENSSLKYFVLHVNNPEGGRKFAGRLKEIIGNDPIAILEAAPVLGLHTGPGTLAVACLSDKLN